jgi:hypothetical protein
MAPRAASQSLDSRGEVLRLVNAPDEGGGVSEGWALGGSYPCSLYIGKKPIEAESPSQGVVSQVNYELHVPLGADIRASDRFAIPGWLSVWARSHAVAVGAKAIPAATNPDYWVQCVQAGTTGATAPALPSQIDTQFTDGTVVWKLAGRANYLEIISVDDMATSENTIVLTVKELE